MYNAVKTYDILATSWNILHNYFHGSIKLFLDNKIIPLFNNKIVSFPRAWNTILLLNASKIRFELGALVSYASDTQCCRG